MLASKRLLYVGFMCHQTIEKALKAYWQHRKSEHPPKTHNLLLLCEKTGLLELLDREQLDFIDELAPLNIETRYPSYREEILKTMTEDYSGYVILRTKELHRWIKEKL